MGYDLFMTILSTYKGVVKSNYKFSFRDVLLKKEYIPGLLGKRHMNVRERYLKGSGVVIKKSKGQLSYTLTSPVI